MGRGGSRKRYLLGMRNAWSQLRALALLYVLVLVACASSATLDPEAKPPQALDSIAAASDAPPLPLTAAASDPNAPPLDLLVTKSMLYSAGLKHRVNPYLVMGLAWHESGWNPLAISSAGAIGIMQGMPATAETRGP